MYFVMYLLHKAAIFLTVLNGTRSIQLVSGAVTSPTGVDEYS
jgi:hypothetical protein